MHSVITGSLGHISQPLAIELIQKGHTVTVISSKPDKRSAIEALGARAAIGSLEDIDFLAATFAGADAVYTMIPPSYTEPDLRGYYGRLGRNYAQAITQARVKRVVNLSSYGADLDAGTGIILGSYDIEGMLNTLPGVSVTHLRPAYFYYNLYQFVDMIKTQGLIGSNYGGNDRLVMVAPVDIAVAAAEELGTATGQNVRYIASDDRTASEVARVLGVAIGKPDLQWVVFTDEQVRNSMEQHGMSAEVAASFVDLGASIHSGAMRQDYDLHPPTTMGAVKLEDFATEFAAVYNN